MAEFKDRIVLVTGAGRGIGKAIALAFAAQGAIVAANDITPVNLDNTIQEIRSAGGKVKEYIFDVAKKMPVQGMLTQVVSDWGGIDILVNNAGVEPRAALLEMDEWDWTRTLEVNLSGPFFLIQSAGRLMRPQSGGVILNVAASIDWSRGLHNRAAFIASKMGLIGLTRVAAQELAEFGIRVNAICPVSSDDQVGQLAASPQQVPPSDVASLALLVCSPSPAYLSGQVINLDGGLVLV